MVQLIAVLGGGNLGHAIAADLSLAGYAVNFYDHPQFEGTFRSTLEKGTVEVEDQKTGRHEIAKINRVTTDIEAAISEAEWIMTALPAFGQELFFNMMLPHLKDGQVVFMMTGSFGSLRLRKLLQEKALSPKITVYETNTCPYGARLSSPAKVIIRYGSGPWLGKQSLKGVPEFPHLISALPSGDTEVALREFLNLYPVDPVENVLVVGLNNLHVSAHPIPSLLNAGRIEYANLYLEEDFRLHREGHTPSVQRIEAAVADEVNALIEAIGGSVTLPRNAMKEYFEYQQTLPLSQVSVGPRTLRDRYVTEDVPYTLVPISELAGKLGVATPLINAFIEIASVANNEDYRETGRTLKSLGLDKLDKEAIVNLVEGKN